MVSDSLKETGLLNGEARAPLMHYKRGFNRAECNRLAGSVNGITRGLG